MNKIVVVNCPGEPNLAVRWVPPKDVHVFFFSLFLLDSLQSTGQGKKLETGKFIEKKKNNLIEFFLWG